MHLKSNLKYYFIVIHLPQPDDVAVSLCDGTLAQGVQFSAKTNVQLNWHKSVSHQSVFEIIDTLHQSSTRAKYIFWPRISL